MSVQGIYLHIPFCLKKCNYCDFVSYPVHHLATQSLVMEEYIHCLVKEFHLWQEKLDLQYVSTIYLGGGTPSIMEPSWLGLLIEEITKTLSLSKEYEITVECNPGTVNGSFFRELASYGVNRISLGVESFSAAMLQHMGRTYQPQEIDNAVEQILSANINNLSIDLMYGLPGQNEVMWHRELEQAVKLPINHLSAYGLHLSEETPWGKQLAARKLLLPDEECSIKMFEDTVAFLQEHHLAHYEISNFAKIGQESQHNMLYWSRKDYLGLGVAAASCINNYRWTNGCDLNTYQQMVNLGQLPVNSQEVLTEREVIGEAIFLGLRMMKGINFAEFQNLYHLNVPQFFAAEIEELLAYQLVKMTPNTLSLTDKGVLVSNEVFEKFI